LVTDPFTPVTSDYCRMIKRCYDNEGEVLERRMLRNSSTSEKPYWLTMGGSWPQDERDIELMYKVIIARTGYDETTLRTLVGKLNATTDPWATFTLVKDLETSQYESALDDDGQPTSGCVDLREINQL